jgi:putative Mg2+ transporter-C (MgtC) family protein
VDSFDPLSGFFWKNVGVAILCGAIVGFERQCRGKPLGIRTSILICLATYVFIRLGVLNTVGPADSTRVIGQVVTGVGFLGGGVILTRDVGVTGVTTAAVIWILAATGCAIGLGYHLGAIALAVISVAVLTGVEVLESSVLWLSRGSRHGDEDGDL